MNTQTFFRSTAAALLCAGTLASAPAAALTINFETLADGEALTSQFAGLTFSNAVALHAGVSLNEFEFPPRSGSVVIADDGGPIGVSFANPVSHIDAYFTYASPVTLTAFDVLDQVLGSVTSTYGSNLALSGDAGSSPNELLQLAFAAGIARLALTGDPAGYSFVLDDLSFTPTAVPIPEPATPLLTMIGFFGLLAGRRFLAVQR
ncbi:hypothetical protein [Accumulibacter sp.]|uniref:hypothetical protein n=1 Tax=Accumulibacter sp. TaxID=2053492 RepID=UPI0035B0F72E